MFPAKSKNEGLWEALPLAELFRDDRPTRLLPKFQVDDT